MNVFEQALSWLTRPTTGRNTNNNGILQLAWEHI